MEIWIWELLLRVSVFPLMVLAFGSRVQGSGCRVEVEGVICTVKDAELMIGR